MTSFVHLHLHTEFSIRDSIVRIPQLVAYAKEQSFPALAITDVMNLFGMVKFYQQCLKAGIKPIVGCELWIANADHPRGYHPIIALCQHQKGYQNLTHLISKAYQFGQRIAEVPLIDKAWFKDHTEGFILLSGGPDSEIDWALTQSLEKGKECLQFWMHLFPNRFYCEIQRTGKAGISIAENALRNLAQSLQCPLVATNSVVFMKKADHAAHAARVCIQSGITLDQAASLPYHEGQYCRSAQEMQDLFQDIPAAIQNTVEIAKRCSLMLTLDTPILPSFPTPAHQTEDFYLADIAHQGLHQRFSDLFLNQNPDYQARLTLELNVICKMGFAGYFLIVADFIQWAKAQKIPVGPGRGSGAGSLVAYVLSITDLDPIAYDLLFERFLNPERVSLPDFDIDFCMDNRDRVIEYVAERYGRSRVSQIATFGTMAAKAVVRDVGRVLGHPYGFVDKLAKLIPFEIGMTLEKALSEEQILQKRYQEEEEVRTLLDLALKLEGITRNVGKHAGGVVIAPSALTDFAPLYCEEQSDQFVIQLDKDDVESIGLIKFDFLGLRTLTIIDKAVKNVNELLLQQEKTPIHINHIPLNDADTFALLKRCATTAVFQLESRGMKDLIKRLQPDNLDEIIALVALFRPGPLQSGMVDDFINRKMGRAAVEYPHPLLVPILKSTYGVILYQEQVMQIAQTLAGYSLGEADLLRRAMGKKKPEEMAKQRAVFIQGALQNNVEERTATTIFDLMEKFAGYGFNKSHSAAYALVSYQTAWLKTHFPSAFMAAVLSSDMNHTDKVVHLVEECREFGITVLAPDIRTSQYDFTVNNQGEILYGLGAIKGLGESAIQNLIEEREKQPFRHLWDLCQRIDPKKVNKRPLESLIKSGALDNFGLDRGALMAQCNSAMHYASQFHQSTALGQTDLFADQPIEPPQPSELMSAWSQEELLRCEKETLGMYFSGHPLDALDVELSQMNVVKYRDLLNKQFRRDQTVLIGGLVSSVKTLLTKNNDRMAIITLDDKWDRFEVTLFSDAYQQFRELLVSGALVIIKASIATDPHSQGKKIRVQSVWTLDAARAVFAKKIRLQCAYDTMTKEVIEKLKTFLTMQARGACQIEIEYQQNNIKSTIKLDQSWNVQLSSDIFENIRQITQGKVELAY